MSFLSRRITHLSHSLARSKSPLTYLQQSKRFSSSGTELSTNVTTLVHPLFSQTPPAWVRYAWPIIIANGLILGSAVEITWNHWATLVKDLDETGEQNRVATDAPPSASSLPKETNPTTTSHWEQKPAWLRAAFCGMYGAGWALSTAFLLKYRQTYTTKIRFFRAPFPSSTITSSSTVPSSSTTLSSAGSPNQKIQRLIHISTASKPNGVTLPLKDLTIQDGRNETELVIRYQNPTPLPGSAKVKRKRDYWYISLTEARVQGAKMGDVDHARNELIWAFDGVNGREGPILGQNGIEEGKINDSGKRKRGVKQSAKGGWQNGPVRNR